MDSLKMSLVVVTLLVIVGSHVGSALECYRCNSAKQYEGKECEENYEKFLVDCNDRSAETGLNYTMCRKFDQTIEDDHRIDRDCAVEGSGRCILRTGTKEIRLEYCECKGNLCNSAPSSFTVTTVLSMFLSALLAFAASS